jgi:hypothetical protein
VVRIAVVVVGVALVGAALVIAKRPRDYQIYGGVAAFSFHLLVITCLGAALIAGALLSVSSEAIGFLFVALGLSDVVVGIVARRRYSRRD